MKKVLKGTPNRPRLYVFRSNKHIYAQIIDDTQNKILTSKSSLSSCSKNKSFSRANCKIAESIGTLIAQDCIQKGIHQVVFDRGNKLYHGRIKALAESARKEGIEF
uniref:Large ribosomal subunit protein uL18c n=1 Tax=Helminthora furcellata TaxID=1884666 RepID=A0A1G4NZH7_9FLOR|nr:Ribosomal protein L18 [Helminthora furcellata]SCW21195.1 Ribosomal protein L18 [Helminthora furcellata]SCW24055.1 Ribosomal protein L18 [Helminthora furcellata]